MKLFLLLATAAAVNLSMEARENPIRRIVNLLQNTQKKVEEEGAKMDKMFEKFVCYCATNSKSLQSNVEALTEEVPQHESAVKACTEQKAQIEEELVAHKADRGDCNDSIETATKQRLKDKTAFDAYSTEAKSNVASMIKAVDALRKGMGDSFMQSAGGSALQHAVTMRMDSLTSFDADTLNSYLQGKMQGSSGEIVGILDQMREDMSQDLTEAEESEASSVAEFDGLVSAKDKSIAAATTAIEDKTGRVGTLAVEIVEAKNDLKDTQAALAADTQFLLELKATCAGQQELYETVKKTRAEEIEAVGATIKILNDDDALDLFKSAVPSFVQVSSTTNVRAHARNLLNHAANEASKISGSSSSAGMELHIMMLALSGKKAGFDKIIVMMDNMVGLLKKEQKDDEQKKDYCKDEFEETADKKDLLNRKIEGINTVVGETKEALTAMTQAIAELTTGINDLDKAVEEATNTRKDESAEYQKIKAQNSAAIALLEVAKNQLNKFYNPKLYKAPERRELSEEERIYVNSGGLDPRDAEEAEANGNSIAGTGVTAFLQLSMTMQMKTHGAPPPPPMVVESYKSQDGGGPIALLDRIMNDLKLEMKEDDMEEKQAQADYEAMMKNSASKRSVDGKSIVEKEEQKAGAEEALAKAKKELKGETTDLASVVEYISNLHKDCDFLVENFDDRKKARTNEIEAIGKAKSVLNGADVFFTQTSEQKFMHARKQI